MKLDELDGLVDRGYPRPQLVRDGWHDLCGEWEFGFDDLDVGVEERWWEPGRGVFDHKIVVPFPVECVLSGIGDRGLHGRVWYRRQVQVPLRESGQRLLLHFGAVDYRASVWVNGCFLGIHEGGQTPFCFDAEGAVALGSHRADGQVVVTVRVEDDPTDVSQPRGKQDWRSNPHAVWYHRTTGVWQSVWWEVVPRCHVTSLNWDSKAQDAAVSLEVELSQPPPEESFVRVTLEMGAERLAEVRSPILESRSRVLIALPALESGWERGRFEWSPGSPSLLSAQVEIVGSDGATVDKVDSYLGLRSVEARNNRFLLNGRPEYLRLVLAQGYWPESHLAAPNGAALRREVELAKGMGFNGVRVHQKVEDPRFLYWADRLGLMVWGEMPSSAGFSSRSVGALVREWQEVVRRDRSHPCVVAWVPLNESWGVPDLAGRADQRELVAALYHLTHALDPSRPVISNDGWQHLDSDIWTIHDYAPSGATLRERYGSGDGLARVLADRWPGHAEVLLPGARDRGQPVVLSEFGGLTYARAEGDTWFGYRTVPSPQILGDALAELVGAVVSSQELAGFCYTQLTDTEQEQNGLAFADRVTKLPAEELRRIFSQPAKSIASEEVAAARMPKEGSPPAPAAGS